MDYATYKTNDFFLFAFSNTHKKLNMTTETPTVIGLQCHYAPINFTLKHKPLLNKHRRQN